MFAVSALLLVGGVADALSLSALFGGLVAGVFWRYAGGARARRSAATCSSCSTRCSCWCCWWPGLARSSRRRRSPSARPTSCCASSASWPAAPWPARASASNAPRDLGLHLLPPGVFGVAFALNAVSVVGADASVLLAAVVVGTIGVRARRARSCRLGASASEAPAGARAGGRRDGRGARTPRPSDGRIGRHRAGARLRADGRVGHGRRAAAVPSAAPDRLSALRRRSSGRISAT